MSIETMFLVLSDLHFSRDLFEAPEMPLMALTGKLKWLTKDTTLRDIFVKQCAGHDIACVKKLPFYLQFIIKEAQAQGYARETFDLCILLGDQVTIPDSQAYKFLREYLTQREYRSGDGYIEYRCSGLGFADDQILAIPGNHDKLLRTNLELYHREFSAPLGLSEQVEPQRCELAVRRFGSRQFLFILVDAGRYAAEELRFDASSRTHLAAGEITSGLRDDVRQKLSWLNSHHPFGSSALPFAMTAKILLVHFPVDHEQFKSAGDLRAKILPHECDGLSQMVGELQREFQLDVVLHGHLHRAMLYNYDGVQVVSATTGAQSGGNKGFYIIKVSDTGKMHAEHHSWNGASFAVDPDASLSGAITDVPSPHKAA